MAAAGADRGYVGVLPNAVPVAPAGALAPMNGAVHPPLHPGIAGGPDTGAVSPGANRDPGAPQTPADSQAGPSGASSAESGLAQPITPEGGGGPSKPRGPCVRICRCVPRGGVVTPPDSIAITPPPVITDGCCGTPAPVVPVVPGIAFTVSAAFEMACPYRQWSPASGGDPTSAHVGPLVPGGFSPLPATTARSPRGGEIYGVPSGPGGAARTATTGGLPMLGATGLPEPRGSPTGAGRGPRGALPALGTAGFVTSLLLEPVLSPGAATEAPGGGDLQFMAGPVAAVAPGAGPGPGPAAGGGAAIGGAGGDAPGVGAFAGPIRPAGAPPPMAVAGGQQLKLALGQGGKGQPFDLGLAGAPVQDVSGLTGPLVRGLVSGSELLSGQALDDAVAEFMAGYEQARAASGKTPAFDAAAVEATFRDRERIPMMPGLQSSALEAVEELGKEFAAAAARQGNTPAFDAAAVEAAFRELEPSVAGAEVRGRTGAPAARGGRVSGAPPDTEAPAVSGEDVAQRPSRQPVVGTSPWPSAQPVPARTRTTITSRDGRPPPGVPVTPEDSYVGGYVPRRRKEAICPEASAVTDPTGSGDVRGEPYVAPDDVATNWGWAKPSRFGKQVAVMPPHSVVGVGAGAMSPSFAAIGIVAPDSSAASAFGQRPGRLEQLPVRPDGTDDLPPPGPAFPRAPVIPAGAIAPRPMGDPPATRAPVYPPQWDSRAFPGSAGSGFGRPGDAPRVVSPPGGPQVVAPPPTRRGRSSPAFLAAVAASSALDRSVEAAKKLEEKRGSYEQWREAGARGSSVAAKEYEQALRDAAAAGPVRPNLDAYTRALRQVTGNTRYNERDQRLVLEEAARQKKLQADQERREARHFARRYGADPGGASGERADRARARRDAGETAEVGRGEARAAKDAARDARKHLNELSGKMRVRTANDVKRAVANVRANQKALDTAARALKATARSPYATSGDLKRARERFDQASAALADSEGRLARKLDDAEREAAGLGPRGEVPPGSRAPSGDVKAPPDSGAEQAGGPKVEPAVTPQPVVTPAPTGTFPDCGPCSLSCEGQCHPPCKEDEVCRCEWVEGTVPTAASGTAPPPPPPRDGPPTVAPPYSPPGSTAGSGPDSGLGKGGGPYKSKFGLTPPIVPRDSVLACESAFAPEPVPVEPGRQESISELEWEVAVARQESSAEETLRWLEGTFGSLFPLRTYTDNEVSVLALIERARELAEAEWLIYVDLAVHGPRGKERLAKRIQECVKQLGLNKAQTVDSIPPKREALAVLTERYFRIGVMLERLRGNMVVDDRIDKTSTLLTEEQGPHARPGYVHRKLLPESGQKPTFPAFYLPEERAAISGLLSSSVNRPENEYGGVLCFSVPRISPQWGEDCSIYVPKGEFKRVEASHRVWRTGERGTQRPGLDLPTLRTDYEARLCVWSIIHSHPPKCIDGSAECAPSGSSDRREDGSGMGDMSNVTAFAGTRGLGHYKFRAYDGFRRKAFFIAVMQADSREDGSPSREGILKVYRYNFRDPEHRANIVRGYRWTLQY